MKRLSIFCLFALLCFSSMAQLKEIFNEDFSSNKNKWITGEIEKLSVKVENGKYIIDSKMKNTVTPQVLAGVDSSKDFTIGASIKSVSVNGTAEYGLIFGSNKYAYYCFTANINGVYGLYYVINNSIKEIIPLSKTAYLKQGLNQTNRLDVKKSGKLWKLFINDSLVNSTGSRKFYGPFIGVMAENMKTEFDDLKITGRSVATSGNLCTLFPLIFNSAKNNFEYIKGPPQDNTDTTLCYSSIQLAEDKDLELDFFPEKSLLYAIIKNNNTSADAIKFNDNLVIQLRKCLPGYIFTMSKNEKGLPQYTITEKIKSAGKQPLAILGISESEFFITTLNIISTKEIIAPQEKKPTSGWIVNDDFRDNRNGWLVDSTNADFASYFKKEMFKKNIEYFLDNKNKTNSHFLAIDNVIYNEKNNYKVEFEFNDYTGDDNKGNGLIFGCDKMAKNYFRFVITQTGSFRIDKITEQGETEIQEWKKSDVIFSNNKLGIINIKGLWKFYINNKEVYFCKSQPLFGNGAGFYIGPECAFFCMSFKAYDWTVAAKFPAEPKEFIYKNILMDIFRSNENNWSTIDDADVTASVNDFGYQLENKNSGFYMPAYNSAWTVNDDFIAETRVMHTSGNDHEGYGLSLGKKDASNAYVFMIDNFGMYRIGYYDNDVWKDIKGWTENKIIESAITTTDKFKITANTLRFENILGEWKFYINDLLVYNCKSKEILGRGTGFFVEGKQTVVYHVIKINQVTFPSE